MLELKSILLFSTALMFSLALIPLILRVSNFYQLYDQPDVGVAGGGSRRVHALPVPRLGGVGIVLAFYLSVCIWLMPGPLLWIFIPSTLLFVVGVVDDLKSLAARFRFVIQVTIAALTVVINKLAIPAIVLTPELVIPLNDVVGYALSTFIVVGAINSINMIDGLDGLAGGVVLIGLVLLSYLHFLRTEDLLLLVSFSLPLIGALLGFLRYNTHPASVFMGDGGSNWLGYMIGIFCVFVLGNFGLVSDGASRIQISHIVRTSTASMPFLTALLCLAVPIVDTLCVILVRLRNGQSPFRADRRHFHHGLLRLGLSHAQSVTTIYFLAFVIGVAGILPVAMPMYALWWTPYVGLLMLLGVVVFTSVAEDSVIKRITLAQAYLSNKEELRPGFRSILRFWETANRYVIYLSLFLTPFFAGTPPKSVGYAAFACLILLAFSQFLSWSRNDFLMTLIISLSATVLLVANNANEIHVEINGGRYNVHFLYNIAFVWLLCSTVAFVLMTFRKRYLFITPTDFLMIALPLLILLVPEPYKTDYHLTTISLRSLVLFMSIRALVRRNRIITHRIRLITMGALIFVALTSLAGLKIVY